MAFTVQAATWETDLFMFSFMSFWGIKYGGSLLYLNATASARNEIASWSQTQASYSRNCKIQGPVWSPVVLVAVLPPRAGGAGLVVEEQADFRKFPDSHLPLLSGRWRRNEIRQRQMG